MGSQPHGCCFCISLFRCRIKTIRLLIKLCNVIILNFSPTNRIRGLSYQTFIEVTAAIESAEMRRCQHHQHGVEHPRASSTDDVEGFFSLSRRIIGDHFTLKEFIAQWRKITRFVINHYVLEEKRTSSLFFDIIVVLLIAKLGSVIVPKHQIYRIILTQKVRHILTNDAVIVIFW